ncbi:hypothetical protein B2G71_02380 [Novosphingobium sp. PC22D]|uniref:flagellar biosynthesis anti-sigma factor FlgM n=1 Tax=Novosphingobium sp. PC22D TaxID=1962403 RepID=UPI000BF0A29E|nr:flagellar biosynthesis anti-sigma factor FlgM [Novosphingobium sp. PC22D]PEQ14460.1 hypothetical protein B2G71_02380 [Novosphingobium sp. PC22D]
MPPIEVGRTEAVRAISSALTRMESAGKTPARQTETVAAGNKPAAATVEAGAALDPGQPPVDFERVQTIRKAVETGNYPLIPAKIADAMIAAGVMLRSPSHDQA